MVRLLWNTGLIIAAIFGPLASAQWSGWEDGQASSDFCNWGALRGAQINDTIYLDGGVAGFYANNGDGSRGGFISDLNLPGYLFRLPLNESFQIDGNLTGLLNFDLCKANGCRDAGNDAPTFLGGGLLANLHEIFFYGGTMRARPQNGEPPDGDEILEYRLSVFEPWSSRFLAGTEDFTLENNVDRYLAYGAAVNAPSENKAWYFSGITNESQDSDFYDTPSMGRPKNESSTMITVDLASQGSEEFTKVSSDAFKGRFGPSAVWVPVGEKGIVVAFGGVVYPAYTSLFGTESPNKPQSEEESPGFMTTIEIYNVASEKWYQQTTSGPPPGQLTQGCAVLATAKDASSFNIYYYGGYDGLDPTNTDSYSDDVFVLSLPSFTWAKLTPGNRADHARKGHQCFMPYPDQMMVIGGDSTQSEKCLDSMIRVYNVNTGTWQTEYNPSTFDTYKVPQTIIGMIGGDETGGATKTEPLDGWDNDDLADIFGTSYDMNKISTPWPYEPANSDSNERHDEKESGGGSGTPKWVPPVLGVVLGLVFVTAIVVAILLWRRRKMLRKNGGQPDSSTDENGNRVLSWIRGQNGNEKAPTVTSDETPQHAAEDLESRPTPMSSEGAMAQSRSTATELPHTPLVELWDTSPRVELSDTGMTPVDIINKHTHFAPNRRSNRSAVHPSSSIRTASLSQDPPSTEVSVPSGGVGVAGAVPGTGTASTPLSELPTPPLDDRAVSPELVAGGNAATATGAPTEETTNESQQHPPRSDIVSGLSGVSEGDRGHLRQLSENTISTASMAPGGDRRRESGGVDFIERTFSPSPEPPVQEEGQEGNDERRVSQQQQATSSPLRRESVFSENREDMGEKGI